MPITFKIMDDMELDSSFRKFLKNFDQTFSMENMSSCFLYSALHFCIFRVENIPQIYHWIQNTASGRPFKLLQKNNINP